MMAPYKNNFSESNNKPLPQTPVLKPESHIPPVLQQTASLYQPYQPKKDAK